MSKRFRLLLLLIAISVAGVFFYPTIKWYFYTSASDRESVQRSRLETQSEIARETQKVTTALKNLALENQNSTVPKQYQFLIPTVNERYRATNKPIPQEWYVNDLLASFTNEADINAVITEYYFNEREQLKNVKSRIILLGLDLYGGVQVLLEPDLTKLREQLGEEPSEAQISEAINLALEVITNRIDRFGITEPQIRQRDDNTIEITLPGENDPERIQGFLVGKGQLNFHIVDDGITAQLNQYEALNPNWDPTVDDLPEFIQAGTRVIPYITRDEFGIEQFIRNIVINNNINEFGLSGEYIQDAQFVRDPLNNQPVVNFVLDIEGSSRFATLTEDNIGNSMAIVVDDEVRAYASIRERIPNGQVRISGFDQIEAQNIARVLRTASLPVDLEIVSQQTVGASLGEETVRSGLRAILLGLILVALFIFVYYKGMGLFADVMLLFNLALLLSILAVFNLTLTLTSIAGIILTIGMSVDANVIIYERIKEEYRVGKSAAASVSAGFKKAFWTIMDANITTFIAALFLSQFASGPIRGFAVTLSVGIITSMFTALFVSRLFFEFMTETLQRKKLSIAWKRISSK